MEHLIPTIFMIVKNIIEIISSVVTLILSLLAFGFSIYAYRKVSFKNDFKKKQLKTVYKLINVLQDTIVLVHAHRVQDSPSNSCGTMFRFFRIEYSKERYKEFVSTNAFFVTEDPERLFEFIKFSEHPYMVPEIAYIIRQFVPFTYNPIDYKKFESFTVIGGSGIFDLFDNKLLQISDNPVYKDFESFCIKCTELNNAIYKWLKSIGIDNFNKKEIIK
jgi:hypothetical protein